MDTERYKYMYQTISVDIMCKECGAQVHDMTTHDLWHALINQLIANIKKD